MQPWLEVLDFVALTPSNASATCRLRPGTESLIDYALVSRCSVPMVGLEADAAVPAATKSPKAAGDLRYGQKESDGTEPRVYEVSLDRDGVGLCFLDRDEMGTIEDADEKSEEGRRKE